jgi:hypothetical protein
MTSVTQFAQYLLKLDPQRLPARLALYNYLKQIMEPTLPFTPGVIQTFYGRVLQFDFWQRESAALSATIRADIASFIKNQPMENDPSWGLIRHPDTLQVIRLTQAEDLEDIVDCEHAARRKSGDKVKLLRISDSQMMVLIMPQDGGLEVKVYPASALVWGARLRLMTPTSHLQYTSNLELVPHVRQVVEGTLLTTLCFHVDQEGVHGLVTRGHTFQKFETFIRAKMTETQDLFFSLKRLEKHFINAQSDPFYQEVVAHLEKAHKNLAHPNPDTIMAADKALTKGRLVLRNVFPNDRLLQILVTHLEYGITQTRSNNEKISTAIQPRTPQ